MNEQDREKEKQPGKNDTGLLYGPDGSPIKRDGGKPKRDNASTSAKWIRRFVGFAGFAVVAVGTAVAINQCGVDQEANELQALAMSAEVGVETITLNDCSLGPGT